MSQLQLVHWMHNEVKIQIEHVAGMTSKLLSWTNDTAGNTLQEIELREKYSVPVMRCKKKNGGEPLLVVVERVMVNDADCAESEQEHKQFPVADLVQRSFEDKKLLG